LSFLILVILTISGSLLGGTLPQGRVNKFPWGASPYAPYNMKSSVIKFSNKYICFHITAYLQSGSQGGLKQWTIG